MQTISGQTTTETETVVLKPGKHYTYTFSDITSIKQNVSVSNAAAGHPAIEPAPSHFLLFQIAVMLYFCLFIDTKSVIFLGMKQTALRNAPTKFTL